MANFTTYRMSLCYYCKNNKGYDINDRNRINCEYEGKKILPRMSTCAAQILTPEGWNISTKNQNDTNFNIDKDLVKIYRDILINKLKNPNVWTIKTPYHNDIFYKCIGIDNGDYETNIIFEIFENKIYIILNGRKLYHFNLYTNWDLYYYFIKLKLNIKKLVNNIDSKIKEDILKNSLPIAYKRKLKINKIKKKI